MRYPMIMLLSMIAYFVGLYFNNDSFFISLVSWSGAIGLLRYVGYLVYAICVYKSLEMVYCDTERKGTGKYKIVIEKSLFGGANIREEEITEGGEDVSGRIFAFIGALILTKVFMLIFIIFGLFYANKIRKS